MLAGDRVVFLELQFLGRLLGVPLGGVEIACIGGTLHIDEEIVFLGHEMGPFERMKVI